MNPETGYGTGQDGETASGISEKLEFMTKSQEFRAEPDSQSAHHGKVERVTYSKVKHTAGQKEDTKKVENNTTQDNPAQDDIGKSQTSSKKNLFPHSEEYFIVFYINSRRRGVAPVVQRLDNAIHRISHYPVDSDLSSG